MVAATVPESETITTSAVLDLKLLADHLPHTDRPKAAIAVTVLLATVVLHLVHVRGNGRVQDKVKEVRPKTVISVLVLSCAIMLRRHSAAGSRLIHLTLNHGPPQPLRCRVRSEQRRQHLASAERTRPLLSHLHQAHTMAPRPSLNILLL